MKLNFLIAAAAVAVSPALAQDAPEEAEPPKVWSGEGSVGASLTTGNTDTVNVAVGLKLGYERGPWVVTATGNYDYGEIEGVTSQNRFAVALQANRDVGDRAFLFGRTSYEQDDFSGFESRFFIGIGGGYHILKGDKTTWMVEASPGFRFDELQDVIDPVTLAVIEPGQTVSNFAARGASRFKHIFNDAVFVTNDTDVIWTSESTQTINLTALNTQFTERLSGRLSFEVRNDTNPPEGFQATDTATRFSIVYGF